MCFWINPTVSYPTSIYSSWVTPKQLRLTCFYDVAQSLLRLNFGKVNTHELLAQQNLETLSDSALSCCTILKALWEKFSRILQLLQETTFYTIPQVLWNHSVKPQLTAQVREKPYSNLQYADPSMTCRKSVKIFQSKTVVVCGPKLLPNRTKRLSKQVIQLKYCWLPILVFSLRHTLYFPTWL